MLHRFAPIACAIIALLLPAAVCARRPPAPIDVVRAFCQADGRGERVHPRTWRSIAPLVTWELEPAWDIVALISGYEIRAPRIAADHVEIDVQYTVTQTVSGAGVDDTQHFDTVTFNVIGNESGGWRIAAPPSMPHLFDATADSAALQAALASDSSTYVSASAFVWRMLTDAGRSVPYRAVSQLRDPELFTAIGEPEPGDVALFLADDVPYQVGVVASDGSIASATVNGGIMRTSPDAFAGAVLYLRPKPTPTPSTESTATPMKTTVPRRPHPTPTIRSGGKRAPSRTPTVKKANVHASSRSAKANKKPARQPTKR